MEQIQLLRALIENDTIDNGRIHVNLNRLSLALERQSNAVFLQPATARVNIGASAAAASNITFSGLMESVFHFTSVQFLHGFLNHSLDAFS